MDMFEKFDKDQSGEIDLEEFKRLLSYMGNTVSQETFDGLVRAISEYLSYDGTLLESIKERDYFVAMRMFIEQQIALIADLQ